MDAEETLYIKHRGRQRGPLTRDDVVSELRKGTLTPIHRVSADQQRWCALHELPAWRDVLANLGLNAAFGQAAAHEPPPLPPQTTDFEFEDDEPMDVELLD